MWVALGVSGGIAAYKTPEIVRGLGQAGAEVQVILTANATQFVTPLVLQTLSRRRVLLDPFDLGSDETIRHIDLTRRIQAFLVAPATANVLAKLARGVADDLLSTFYTAVTAPVSPSASHPVSGSRIVTARERKRATFSCVSGCSHIRVFIAGATTTGAVTAV